VGIILYLSLYYSVNDLVHLPKSDYQLLFYLKSDLSISLIKTNEIVVVYDDLFWIC